MAKTRTKKWHAAEHLKTDEDMAAYLEAALGDIARAKGVGRGHGVRLPNGIS